MKGDSSMYFTPFARGWPAAAAVVSLCALSVVSFLFPKSFYSHQQALGLLNIGSGTHGGRTQASATEEILDNGVNMDRAFGPLEIERAPSSPGWSNSLALCTSIKWEMPEDVLEWVQYYKYEYRTVLTAVVSTH